MSNGWAGRVEEAACLLSCRTAVIASVGECGMRWRWKSRGGCNIASTGCDVGAVMSFASGSSKVAEPSGRAGGPKLVTPADRRH